MPLVRFQVRNEYGLGQPELYKEANKEDPKAVLDGVAVSGLVGILRQLGDLAEFAAEVFHGLQEQVITTASRSHKLMVRVQYIEAALPPLEKVVLAQTSHIHFAYTAGLEWHPRIRNERNHFIYNDLPRFIMDSYEECRDPPRLHVLDKFDTGGPGSCLKRYSDPTFFKKASATSDEANAEKIQRDRKARRIKKKRSSKRNGEVSSSASISNIHNSSMQYISPIADGRSSPSQTASTVDMASKYDLGNHSNSFDSRTESGYIECVFHQSFSKQADEQESKEISSSKLLQHNDNLDSLLPNDYVGFVDDNFPRSSLLEQVTSGSFCVTWDEKAEIMETNVQDSGVDESETPDMLLYNSNRDAQGVVAGNIRIGEQMDVCHGAAEDNILESISSRNQIEEIESETDNYMDALNTIDSESENDLDCQTKREVEQFASIVDSEGNNEMHELSMHIEDHKPPTFESQTASYISSNEEMTSDLLNSVSSECVAVEHELSVHYNDHKSPTFESQNASCISSNKEMTSDILNSVSSESVAFENECSMRYKDHKPPTFESQTATYISSDKETTSDLLNLISSQSVACENELSMCYKDHKPPTFETQTATCISSDKEMTSDLLNSISSQSVTCEQMPVSDMSLNKEIPFDLSNSLSLENQPRELMFQKAGGSLNSDCSVGTGRIDDISDGLKLESVTGNSVKLASVIGDGSQLESVIGDPSSSASETTDERDPSGDKTISSSCESQESSADISSNHSVKIWTNGFLLGLEPSKPSDFTMSRAVTQDLLNRSKAETIDTYMLKGEENGGGEINSLTENIVSNEKNASSIHSTSCPGDQEDGISTMKTSHVFSPTYLDPKNGDFDDPHTHNGYSNVSDKHAKEIGVLKPVAALQVAHDINSTSTEANKENDETSSLVFGLSRRLLSNGFGRNISHANGEKGEPANSWTSVLEQKSELHGLPERAFKEQFGFGSALDLLTSSPPLGHMKISFHPIDDFETSKLKLKFSDGSQSHESTRDMFPSFQLIPESAIPVDDFGSDSDDDTFCRSSPSVSDDCLSHHSDSNSEQWESRESSERKDEIYSALRGISSTECISSFMELGGIKQVNSGNGVEASISDPILDFPNFDTVKPALQQETKNDSDPKIHLYLSPGETPAPPPLPPVQWCVSKPHLNVREGKQDVASDAFDHAFGAELLGSTAFQQPKLAQAKQEQTNEEPFLAKPKLKLDKQKKEANEALNGKDMDDRGDFLQQIIAKSFSLRRTVTEKSTTTPGPAANVKVTAILEKANAIRQAVGSDDGENDDNWSDT